MYGSLLTIEITKTKPNAVSKQEFYWATLLVMHNNTYVLGSPYSGLWCICSLWGLSGCSTLRHHWCHSIYFSFVKRPLFYLTCGNILFLYATPSILQIMVPTSTKNLYFVFFHLCMTIHEMRNPAWANQTPQFTPPKQITMHSTDNDDFTPLDHRSLSLPIFSWLRI
jgi:hypothetical protein